MQEVLVQLRVHAPAAQEQLRETQLIRNIVEHVLGKYVLGLARAESEIGAQRN